MRTFVAALLVASLTFDFTSPAFAFMVGGNAVHFSNVPLVAGDLNDVPVRGTTFFLSFWYNLNQRPYAGMDLFRGTDTAGRVVLDVSFVGDRSNPYLEVDAIDENGRCAHLSTQDVVTVPFDGNWHNVVLQLFVVELTDGNFIRAQFALDGAIREMNGSVGLNPVGAVAGYSFNDWFWTPVTWEMGLSYLGDLAEWYMDLQAALVSSQLTTAVVSNFIDVNVPTSAAPNGSAPGLGASCVGPTGGFAIAPTMCDKGGPCNFVIGPVVRGVLTYVLGPFMVNGRFWLSSAATEPCKFTNDGGGTDGYTPGTGCPVMAHP